MVEFAEPPELRAEGCDKYNKAGVNEAGSLEQTLCGSAGSTVAEGIRSDRLSDGVHTCEQEEENNRESTFEKERIGHGVYVIGEKVSYLFHPLFLPVIFKEHHKSSSIELIRKTFLRNAASCSAGLLNHDFNNFASYLRKFL